ncbi:MAG: heme ABC exporter ATP-binding protein CcmA [Pseudomonadota bacterium]
MTLTATDLACARGGIPILEGVSFGVPDGRALILRGPNGIGKTTLLRCLVGLQPLLRGHVAPGPDACAYASHADAVKTALSVAENLRFWSEIYGAGGIDAALQAMDLTALSTRPAAQLSAGQTRRLGLARLLLTGRPIWVLDEPTVALDRASVALFAKAVLDHCAAGGSAVIATHIDLGLEAETLDLSAYRARELGAGDFDEAFL